MTIRATTNPSGYFAAIKEKMNPQTVLQHGLGIHFLSAWICDFFLSIGNIAYAKTFFQYSYFNLKVILIWYQSRARRKDAEPMNL